MIFNCWGYIRMYMFLILFVFLVLIDIYVFLSFGFYTVFVINFFVLKYWVKGSLILKWCWLYKLGIYIICIEFY